MKSVNTLFFAIITLSTQVSWGNSDESITPDDSYQHGLAYAAGYHVEQDLSKAAHYFSLASERGHAKATVNLAHHYYRGAGVEKDPERAINLFSSACDMEEVLGCKALATFYAKGEIVAKDTEKAYALYQPAVDNGDPEAMLNQADLLLNEGSNPTKAIALINSAALLKYPPAIYKLGTLYYYGEIIDRDFTLAYAWVDIAAMMGHKDAKSALPVLSSRMSPDQIRNANLLSKELRQLHYKDIFEEI